MNAIETIPFEFKKRQYEIRVVTDGVCVYVRAFHRNRPANGYRYSIDLMVTAPELRRLKGMDGIRVLIEHAKQDVFEERWERLQELMKKAK